MLQPSITILLGFISLLTGLTIVVLLYRAGTDNQFGVTDHYVYFTAQYLPSIIGTLTVTVFRSAVQEFHLMTPYFAMADRVGDRSGAPALRSVAFRYFPNMFLFASKGLNLNMFADILTPIVLFLIVPIKAALLCTQQQSDGTWAVVVHRLPALYLTGGYALMTLFLLVITVHLWDRQTGLKWYPAALADQLALFRNPRTLSYFAQLEKKESLEALRGDVFKDVNFRLGYWNLTRSGSKDVEIWYGIGVIDDSTRGCTPFRSSDQLLTCI